MDFEEAASAAHALSPQEIIPLLGADASRGLTAREVDNRLARFGPNRLPPTHRESLLSMAARQFRNLLVLVLILAAAVSLIVWIARRDAPVPYDTLVILAIVLGNAGLGFFQEYRARLSLQKLQSLSAPGATVIRDGGRIRIGSDGLVPGDLVILTAGDRVPADARLLDCTRLRINESMLTGESATVLKGPEVAESLAPVADRTSMVFGGTTVTGGRALALVTATGGATEAGAIARLIESSPRRETPLEKSLSQLGKRLALLVIGIAVIVSISGLLVSGPLTWDNALNFMLFGVALAVAAIPEGLPAVVTGALSLGSQRMARRRAIVRRLPAVETLGSTSAICSDKTGTLTAGEMTVREIVTPSGTVLISGAGYAPEGEASGPTTAIREAAALAFSAVLCNDASIQESGGRWQAVGSPTEASLVTMAFKLGVDYALLRQQNSRLAEEPFTAEKKRMSVAVSGGGGLSIMHTKGAPETVLPLCGLIASRGGLRQLDEDDRRELLSAAGSMASRGLRPLAVATRRVKSGNMGNIEEAEKEMVLLGIAGILDPPRPEAAAAVKACRRAGIEVFMVTGDHAGTALNVAGEVGIKGELMTGPEIDAADDAELARKMNKVRIFARTSPGQKVRIVNALKQKGQTVAVTGDGVNDAPALRRADIGVAMGVTGTDVAREAADMVLADDNFATIVAAVEEGRAIFSNIRKFVTYLLSSNAGEVLTLFAGVLIAGGLDLREGGQLLLPLLAVQILWINLITDGLPALALGVEPRNPGAMLRPPRPQGEPVINARVWLMIALIGAVSSAGTLLVLDAYYPGGLLTLSSHPGAAYARTMAFVTLALFQMFNAFNSRRLRLSSLPHALSNRWLTGAVVISVAAMAAVVHLPVLQRAFSTVPLAFPDWLVATTVASFALWSAEGVKALGRLRDWGAQGIPLR